MSKNFEPDAIQKLCLSTWKGGTDTSDPSQLIHAALGLTGEIAEMIDKLEQDDLMREELADVVYYLAVCAYFAGGTLEDMVDACVRFPWTPKKYKQESEFNFVTLATMGYLTDGEKSFPQFAALTYAGHVCEAVKKGAFKYQGIYSFEKLRMAIGFVMFYVSIMMNRIGMEYSDAADILDKKLAGGHGWVTERAKYE